MKLWLPVFLALAPIQAFASPPSEWQQRMACTGDAFRLCTHDIPDRSKIRACMTREHDHLSDGCRRVFDASVAAGE